MQQPCNNGWTDLSDSQRAVVEHQGGPLLVVAGAGSGKTRSLTYRCAHLISTGVQPQEILLSTFTKRATGEFRSRLQRIEGVDIQRTNVGTLHSIGAKLLRAYASYLDYPSNFRIVPTPGCQNIIKKQIDKRYPRLKELGAVAIEAQVSRWKERLITPAQALRDASLVIDEDCARLYGDYDQYLKEKKGMDFADLIGNSIVLLQQYPEVAGEVGLKHIMVDEFQDTNAAQFTMIKLLLGESRNLTAVGDIDQAIYSFRGADPQIMCSFTAHFPDATTVSLGENYRCTGNIVRAAANVIGQNKQRIVHDLLTHNPDGQPIVHILSGSDKEEAQKVSQQIHRILQLTDIPTNEIAILYRTNYQASAFVEKLTAAGIPHSVAPEYDGDPLVTPRNDPQGIQMMTLHAAKGTEYQVVFLAGVEENILPHWRALNHPTDFIGAVEEERRLLYVGMTRARQMLYVSSVLNRTTPTGREIVSAPSRFLRDIPEGVMLQRGG